MKDLISVIMPSYNTAKYIGASVQSVQNQTYDNWELIIVDDCSDDGTDDVIYPLLADKRIRYLKNETNCGAALTRNRALREAKGDWIAFLDSDDLWVPQKLEKQLAFMKEHHYSFTYTDYMIQNNGIWMPYVYTAPDTVNRRKMYRYCYFSTITVMYHRETVGLLQIADLRKNNDYALWLSAVEQTDCHRLPLCLSYYVKHDDSVSGGHKIKLIKWHYRLFRIGLNKSPFVSTVLTVGNIFFGVLKKIYYKKRTDFFPSV